MVEVMPESDVLYESNSLSDAARLLPPLAPASSVLCRRASPLPPLWTVTPSHVVSRGPMSGRREVMVLPGLFLSLPVS